MPYLLGKKPLGITMKAARWSAMVTPSAQHHKATVTQRLLKGAFGKTEWDARNRLRRGGPPRWMARPGATAASTSSASWSIEITMEITIASDNCRREFAKQAADDAAHEQDGNENRNQ